jgi:hypothetical protein
MTDHIIVTSTATRAGLLCAPHRGGSRFDRLGEVRSPRRRFLSVTCARRGAGTRDAWEPTGGPAPGGLFGGDAGRTAPTRLLERVR